MAFPSKFSLKTIREIRKIIEEEKPDTVHCHGLRAGFLGRLAGRGMGVKIVYTEHLYTADYNLTSPLTEWWQIQALRYLDGSTDMTIGVSQAVVDFFLAKKITTVSKIVKIYNAIEIPAKQLPLAKKYYRLDWFFSQAQEF